MRLHTILLSPIVAFLLGGCSHYAEYHPMPKTDRNNIPSYCQGIWTGDSYGLSGRFEMDYFNEEAEGVLKYADRHGVIEQSGVDQSSRYFFYKSPSAPNPLKPYEGFYDGVTAESLSDRQIKQLCGIKEGIDNKKIDRLGPNYYAYLNTNSPFDEPEYDKRTFQAWKRYNYGYGEITLFDEANSVVMAKIKFTRDKGESLTSAVERIYADWLKQASSAIDRVHKEYYEKQIPPMPIRPNKPVGRTITKDNFETSEQFAVRVQAEKVAEALAQQKAAEAYIKALEDRNQKILELRKAYTDAIEAQHAENQRAVDWLIREQEKILQFIAKTIVHSYTITSPAHIGKGEVGKSIWIGEYVPEYNADLGVMNITMNYWTGTTGAQVLINKQEALDYYNKATRNGTVVGNPFQEVRLETSFKDGELVIGKLYARDSDITSKWFEVVENGVQPKARKMEAFVIALPPKDDHIYESLDGELAIIPHKSGVWDSAAAMKVADLYNPKAPQWFSTPSSKEKIAYGTGLSLDEAKNDALRELAIMHSANISVKQSTKTKVKGTPSAEVTSEKEVNVSTNKSYTGSYRIIKQEMMDGRWYVSIQAQK